jgi:hypothetical protein
MAAPAARHSDRKVSGITGTGSVGYMPVTGRKAKACLEACAAWSQPASSAAAAALRGQCRFDVSAMLVGVPDRDLRQAPDPTVAGFQIGGGQVGNQPADGRAVAAQVHGRLGLAHRCSFPGVPRIESVYDIAVNLDLLADHNLPYPSREILICVRDVIHDHRDRPGITIDGRCVPILVGAAITKLIIRSFAASMSAAYAAGLLTSCAM